VLKNRKRISLVTLAVFLLTLILSGMAPAFAAEKTPPGSPPVAQAPAPSSGDKDRPNRVSPEGDVVKNSIGQGPKTNALGGVPYLETVSVSPGQLTGFNKNNVGPYEITVPFNVDTITFITDPVDHTDKVVISADSSWPGKTYNNTIDNVFGDFTTDDSITLNPMGQDTRITYYLLNKGGFLQGPDEHRTYTFIVHRLLPDAKLLVGQPQLQPDGKYTVWFGYENAEAVSITLDSSTLAGGGIVISGSVPSQLAANKKEPQAFQVEYSQSTNPLPAWTAKYGQWTQTVTAGVDPTAYVKVEPDYVELVMNENTVATLTATAVNGPKPEGPATIHAYPEITWQSENPDVVKIDSVSANGRECTVSAVSPGEAKVYAYFNGQNASATVKVLQPVEGVSLLLDGKTQLAEDAVLLMSEKRHKLETLITPSTANYPNPLVYRWVIDDSDAVDWWYDGADQKAVWIEPDSASPGTVQVTVYLEDSEGKIYASASCTIHVGSIDVWVEGEPDFYEDGSYEASFGYESTFPVNIEIPATGNMGEPELNFWGNINNLWGTPPGEVIEGKQPTVFEPGEHPNVFRVRYWDGPQYWMVGFEGSMDTAVAKTFQSIRLDSNFEIIGLKDSFTLTADPSFSKWGHGGGATLYNYKEEIVWDIPWQSSSGVISIDGQPNQFTCNVEAQKPGMAIVRVSIVDKDYGVGPGLEGFGKKQALCFVTVLDNRTLTLDTKELSLKKGRSAELNALIGYENLELGAESEYRRFGLPDDWQNVQWGFVVEDSEGRPYIVDSSQLAALAIGGCNDTSATVQALKNGTASVIAYLGNNLFSKKALTEYGVPEELATQVDAMCWDGKLYLDKLPKGRYDTCNVVIKNPSRVVEEEEKGKSKPAPAPATPAPPALESLDVTLTVGSNLAIVNGQQVTLSGDTILIGEDRAMVDYADIPKLLPGVSVAWDWKTQSVTFSIGEQALTMKLDVIPADFDVPFMNIGGRLVVPIRYVGTFFGATVDWLGHILVVHMYK